jgi:large subunit ribosomal protein L5
MKARLEELYTSKLRFDLKKELGLSNIMQVPKISKIVINMGVKEAVSDSKVLNGIKGVLEEIAGQAATKTYAKKSIAGFKVRKGMPLGVKVSLRRKAMYEFLDRLINLSLPRIRDFQGVSTKLDGRGNYNLGIKDWMVFPEVDYDTVEKAYGFNITIETTSSKDDDVFALLKSLNMPFRRK